ALSSSSNLPPASKALTGCCLRVARSKLGDLRPARGKCWRTHRRKGRHRRPSPSAASAGLAAASSSPAPPQGRRLGLSCTSSYGLYAETRFMSQSYRNFPRRSSYKYLRIRAAQGNDGRRRLVDIIRIIPELSRNYFRGRSRRALFGGISLLGGFYVAQTISLSFGALGVNDVIAAVVCVLLTEYVTKFYYSRPKVTFPIALLNNFKMGFAYGLFIDAFKLAS
ncbi:unnamed protein product, partial [Urochloa humidicola]